MSFSLSGDDGSVFFTRDAIGSRGFFITASGFCANSQELRRIIRAGDRMMM